MPIRESDNLAGPDAAKPETSGRLEQVASMALLIVLLLLAAGLAVKTVYATGTQAAMFNHPFQFDESEGMIVAETMLLDRGVNIFGPVTSDLFIAAPYPPLFYTLAWPFQHLLGSEPSFKIGRAISLCATLLSAFAIFGIVLSLSRRRLAAMIAALIFLSLGLITFWGSLVKPDMLALALGLCGLWWLVARPPQQVWWALIFFLLAFYTKQTAIASALTGTGVLLFTRPRTGIVFAGVYGAGVVIPTVLLNVATAGGYFYHEFTLHSLPWFADRYVGFLSSLIVDYGAFLLPGLIAVVVLGALWFYGRTKKSRVSETIVPNAFGILPILYVVASAVVASATGTLGGNHNHLLDLVASLCIGAGVGAGLLLATREWQWKVAGLLTGVVALAWLPSLFSVPMWLQVEFNQLKPEPTAGMMNIFQYVTNNGGPAYSDNVGLMVSTHKRVWTTDPFTQTHATAYHRWDESKLVAAIRVRDFSQIILRIDVNAPDAGAGDVSPAILQAVRDNYKLDQRNVLNIYVPR